jgi:hypothetical protein
MLVSDLLEIGVQQRKAYQDAKQKAAAGRTSPVRRPTRAEDGRANPHIRNLRFRGKHDRPRAGAQGIEGDTRYSASTTSSGPEARPTAPS